MTPFATLWPPPASLFLTPHLLLLLQCTDTISSAISSASIPLSAANPSKTFLTFLSSLSDIPPPPLLDGTTPRPTAADSPVSTPAASSKPPPAARRVDVSKMQSLHSSHTAASADDKVEGGVVAVTPVKSAKKNAVKSSAVATAAVAAALARPSECASMLLCRRPYPVPIMPQSAHTSRAIGAHTC